MINFLKQGEVISNLKFITSSTVFVLCASELPCPSVSRRVFAQNLSYENEFDLHENQYIGGTYFRMSGLARRLSVLTEAECNTEMAY